MTTADDPVAQATIAFVPRETFSRTRQAMETLLERTEEPYNLVCVDGGSPPETRKFLEDITRANGFKLIRSETYLTPNQARNLVLPHVDTPYVVFVDNDVLVSAGWLEALVRCAAETGAWVVGPVYCEREPELGLIHMAGGDCQIVELPGGIRLHKNGHHHFHQPYEKVAPHLKRQPTELIEFHTVLVAMEAFEQLGPLDARLMSANEHCDLCLAVRNAGKAVYLEPASVVTYSPVSSFDRADRAFYGLRWSEAWLEATVRRWVEKHGLVVRGPEGEGMANWQRGHRRKKLKLAQQVERRLGRRVGRAVTRRIIAPLEVLHNKWRYPKQKYGFEAMAEVPHEVVL